MKSLVKAMRNALLMTANLASTSMIENQIPDSVKWLIFKVVLGLPNTAFELSKQGQKLKLSVGRD